MDDSISIETTSRSSSSSTEAFTEFSTFIDKLTPIITGMKEAVHLTDLPAIQKAVDSLETDYSRAKAEAESQTLRCSSPAKHVECLVQSLGRSLGLVLFASHEAPMRNKREVEELCKEMMNARFDSSPDHEFEFDAEVEEAEEQALGVDDVISQIKNGSCNEEVFKNALLMFSAFVAEGMVSDETVTDEDVVGLLTSRMSSCKRGQERVSIIKTLRCLSVQNDLHKEKMKGMEFISALVKSLSRDAEERREAAGLLLSLCDGDNGIKRRVGGIRGCIVMLVAVANDEDREASRDARTLLNSMSGNTQHALHMAEAGYFEPLIKYLNEGSDMSKVIMATALSRLQLTDRNKASLGEAGSIEPLVKMFVSGSLESKLSALNAIKNVLSDSDKRNTERLIESGILAPLLQLMFSVTSVMMTLREPASAILAKVSASESVAVINRDAAHQMLSLLSLTSPVVQSHLLEALNNIVSHPSANGVRERMIEDRAVWILLPFISERESPVRTCALRLVYSLSKDSDQGELDYVDVINLANIVSESTASESAKAAALGILSHLPTGDRKITDILKKAELVPSMVSIVSSSSSSEWLDESVAGLLLRFTASDDKSLQHYSAEKGVIPVLVELLSSASETAKSRAASCLAQLSRSSLRLSKQKSRNKLKWLCVGEALCEVHGGYCSVKGTFCLVKAGAVGPLVRILEGETGSADVAVLSCLSTLLEEEIWEKGCGLIARTGSVLEVLRRGSVEAREKAIWVLERLLRVEDVREEYGESAMVVLIDLVQKGDESLAPAVGKLLAQLQLLQQQSTYF